MNSTIAATGPNHQILSSQEITPPDMETIPLDTMAVTFK